MNVCADCNKQIDRPMFVFNPFPTKTKLIIMDSKLTEVKDTTGRQLCYPCYKSSAKRYTLDTKNNNY